MVGVKNILLSYGFLICLYYKVFLSIIHRFLFLSSLLKPVEFSKPNKNGVVDMSSCLAICGYISSNMGVVTSQTSIATSINCCVTPLYFLSTSSFESKISTDFCYVALHPSVTFDLLFKMFIRKCSNIGCIDSWMSFTHQIATPIPTSNLYTFSRSIIFCIFFSLNIFYNLLNTLSSFMLQHTL